MDDVSSAPLAFFDFRADPLMIVRNTYSDGL